MTKSQIESLSCIMLGWYSTASARRCFGTSSPWASSQESVWFLQSVKDDQEMRTLLVSSISLWAQSGLHWADTRLKGHQRHICLELPDKSAEAEHCQPGSIIHIIKNCTYGSINNANNNISTVYAYKGPKYSVIIAIRLSWTTEETGFNSR
jgi:hypothetical protein